MPIYEYRCNECGHYLDALQKLSDPPLLECPECSQSALKRLISAPSFRLKGSGWYETDFKSDKERKRNLVESAAADGSGKNEAGDKKDTGDKKDSGDKPKETAKSESGSEKKSGDSSSESKKPAAKSKSSGSEAA
jgi:putative FmdB family regulatory protein